MNNFFTIMFRHPSKKGRVDEGQSLKRVHKDTKDEASSTLTKLQL